MMTVNDVQKIQEKILVVIPARGGSKGVSRKNLRLICGKPLIAYTIETALAARHLVDIMDQITLDWILLLQPTAPFRIVEDIEASIALAMQGGCDSVISVERVFSVHPILMKRIEDNRLFPYYLEEKEGTRRQDYHPPAYIRNGAIYLTRRQILIESSSLWGEVILPYVMPHERSINIDNEIDLKLVEILMEERL